jgi:hypothetical protein
MISRENARKLLEIRDSLIQNQFDEAYHQLCLIADPLLENLNHWAELETIAKSEPTEDKPDQPDATPNFNCLTEDALMGIQFKDNQEVWSAISRVKQQLELLWKDYVLPLKEENKRLTDRVGDLLDETKQRSKTYTLLREEVEESQKQIEGLKEENKQLRENLALKTDAAARYLHANCILLDDERETALLNEINRLQMREQELSKKGEPINSELLAALKEIISQYGYTFTNVEKFKALIERAESTPLPIQKVNEEENERSGGWFERSKADFEKMQSESTPLEPVKSEWISVKDRLPERVPNKNYSQVQCLVNKRYDWKRGDNSGTYYQVQILTFNHEHECWDGEDGDDHDCAIDQVTHWQPLPSPPIK